ncbi:MAG: two-component sensor histidine kinase, partial [Deltaproteobacteria bacterium]|nr:two-component sensor histidine kinase [Deltaproteobacteria bacterium]
PCRLVEDVAGLARHEAEARGIELRLVLDPEVPELHLDRSGIKQVLWNLLGNAIDAQGPGGAIEVRCRWEAPNGSAGGGALVLEVEDRGPGIPDELLPRIFEPFFTTKEVGQGTGLGLAVAYSVVRSHDGRIEVENLPAGGCVFRITLPEGERT